MNDFDVLVVANQALLSDEEIGAIKRFVGSGKGLVVTGRSSLYDEHYRQREDYGLRSLFDRENVVFLPSAPEKLEFAERRKFTRHLA